MVVNPSGIVMLSAEEYAKAYLPTFLREEGSVTLFMEE